MRVITGKLKGSKLISPKGLHTRPTSDKVKEAIFNILGNISEGSQVLDLYAGSGNVGIEFLSRGASKCYFIDCDTNSIKSIKENLSRTKLAEQAYVYKNIADKAISMLGSRGILFDYIFLDPPYEKNLIVPTLEKISICNILNENGIIITEHESKIVLPEYINYLFKKDFRKYGGTTISFYINGRLNNESSISRDI
ncbi:16S rRNA (guanine(966)-N(2))-methyltransferase RsmD [Proteiniborus ethanoligenes]|uniref:16S rRNA (Guanine(966)-N(2))-methyltransferase RsmD n=1 Tax=Proteiniborus ethanoligenes TaxID=415015 RepID=A0A1H3PL12_9FIRM|nr:16S rRNA (guanine(966)-N(2))-methyltransferase RsmD [Proteiniborus ethanoligenes]TAH64053.1 MAG: 16S rRNA (guanine(966)-N(2))-methyltransferase RsmD [Gottschalkiaceae bacterium]SDZ01892.1 16S rRNA (guanine(966)-N(2))-methyltransferase RsmD [Proteiniborus ethanoligenes]